MRRYTGLDRNAGVIVKRGRVIHQEAVGQRTETRVDVVEALVGETNRYDLDAEKRLDLLVRLDLCPESVAGP